MTYINDKLKSFQGCLCHFSRTFQGLKNEKKLEDLKRPYVWYFKGNSVTYLVTIGSAAWFGPHRPKQPRPRMPVRPTGLLIMTDNTAQCVFMMLPAIKTRWNSQVMNSLKLNDKFHTTVC